jgi:hydroxymethylpyrimidine/phosphomethylpyrimidine kinase
MIGKVLTIAGSDSGGGAGIQADLKTFQELGVYGMSVITAVTAQNTLGVQAVFPLSAEAVERQLYSIGEDLSPEAVKIGMLHSAEIIGIVSKLIRYYNWQHVVVDPVMMAKGGASLLKESAINDLQNQLLPLAEVVTPNIPEAEVLADMRIQDMADRQKAAIRIHSFGPQHVVIKGGHEPDGDEAVDLLYNGFEFIVYAGKRVDSQHTHGTGCTFASALAAGLAQGMSVGQAVYRAKRFIQAGIAAPLAIGGGKGPTNHWAYRKSINEISAPDSIHEVKVRRLKG